MLRKKLLNCGYFLEEDLLTSSGAYELPPALRCTAMQPCSARERCSSRAGPRYWPLALLTPAPAMNVVVPSLQMLSASVLFHEPVRYVERSTHDAADPLHRLAWVTSPISASPTCSEPAAPLASEKVAPAGLRSTHDAAVPLHRLARIDVADHGPTDLLRAGGTVSE